MRNGNSCTNFFKCFSQIQIQINLFFPEIVHDNYMGIYKMNHSDMVEFNTYISTQFFFSPVKVFFSKFTFFLFLKRI